MRQFGPLILFPAIIALSGCDSATPEPAPATEAPATSSSDHAGLTKGRLGHIRYSYDAHILSRAETELALPPEFTETVFAVKFIPANLVEHIGSVGCSFDTESHAEPCTADHEVGFAIALLERPISHYTTAIARAHEHMEAFEPAHMHGAEGVTLRHSTDHTTTRYTFLPTEGRTLMLVDRDNAGVHDATAALEQVRGSIAF